MAHSAGSVLLHGSVLVGRRSLGAIGVSHGATEAGASPALRSLALWSRLNLLTADYGETSLRTRYLRLRFADLCHQPAAVIAQIFAFCGLAGAVEPSARREVRPPTSLGRWRTQARDTLAALHRVAQVALERFGYTRA